MTRETKIGLLVGLAFIIVIGILLSDHFSTAVQPPQQALAAQGDAADNVRGSVASPETRRPRPEAIAGLPPTRPVIIEPRHQDHGAGGDAAVVVGPSASRQGVHGGGGLLDRHAPDGGTVPPSRDPLAGIVPPGPGGADGTGTTVRRIPGPRRIDGDSSGGDRGVNVEDVPPPQPPVVPPTVPHREHVAEAGDTVSKMAQRYLGSKSHANVQLIIKANPSLTANPNRVVVGETYLIPQPAQATSPVRTTPEPSRSPASVANDARPNDLIIIERDDRGGRGGPVAERVVTDRPGAGTGGSTGTGTGTDARPPVMASDAAAPEVVYTTRPGDTLWSIAVRECGTGSQAVVNQIFEMNKDVLKDRNRVPLNAKLRLPGKVKVGR